MRSAWRWFALALVVVIADQATKALVLARFSLGERLELTSFFNMVLVYNKGAAFSFLSDAGGWQTPALVLFALVAIGVVGTFIVRSPGRTMLLTGLALILGGAIGNLIDRVRFGKVVDFLDFYVPHYQRLIPACDWLFPACHWPAFNLADSAITVGAVLLILEGFVHREGRARSTS